MRPLPIFQIVTQSSDSHDPTHTDSIGTTDQIKGPLQSRLAGVFLAVTSPIRQSQRFTALHHNTFPLCGPAVVCLLDHETITRHSLHIPISSKPSIRPPDHDESAESKRVRCRTTKAPAEATRLLDAGGSTQHKSDVDAQGRECFQPIEERRTPTAWSGPVPNCTPLCAETEPPADNQVLRSGVCPFIGVNFLLLPRGPLFRGRN